MLSYEGLFFDEETTNFIHSLEKNMLANVNDEIHCTFKYHPKEKEIFNCIAGKSFDVYIVGYANDGFNSGFEILLPEELKDFYINYDEENPSLLKIPHITASLADGAKASKTKNLRFEKLDKPIKITGKFGFWIKEDNREYLSFKPYTVKKRR